MHVRRFRLFARRSAACPRVSESFGWERILEPGRLVNFAWTSDFVLCYPEDGGDDATPEPYRPYPLAQTDVALARDEDSLYVVFHALPPPALVRPGPKGPEWVGAYFDLAHDHEHFVAFKWIAPGSKRALRDTAEVNPLAEASPIEAPEADWDVLEKRRDDGWWVAFRIRFEAPGGEPDGGAHVWGINFDRMDGVTGEYTAWAAPCIRRPVVSRFGHVTFGERVPPGTRPRKVDMEWWEGLERGRILVYPEGAASPESYPYDLTLNGEPLGNPARRGRTTDIATTTQFTLPEGDHLLRVIPEEDAASAQRHGPFGPIEVAIAYVAADRAALSDGLAVETPTRDEVAARVRREHERSEALYRGDGGWDGDDVEAQQTSDRIRLYALAYHHLEADPVYLERAREGADLFLRELPISGGNCMIGRTCAALLTLHRYHPDEGLLAASEREVAAYSTRALGADVSETAWAIGHLAEHAVTTGQTDPLEIALVHFDRSVAPNQLLDGSWSGWSDQLHHHAALVRGLAALVEATPEDHPRRREVRRCVVRAINHLLRCQRPGGAFTRRHTGAASAPSLDGLDGLIPADRALGGGLSSAIERAARFVLDREDVRPRALAFWGEYACWRGWRAEG